MANFKQASEIFRQAARDVTAEWLTTIKAPAGIDPDRIWRVIKGLKPGTLIQFKYQPYDKADGPAERYKDSDTIKPGWHSGVFLKAGMHTKVPMSGRGDKRDVDFHKNDKFMTRYFLIRDQKRNKPLSAEEVADGKTWLEAGYTAVNIDLGVVTVFQVNKRV